ncbi:naringenin-chalcone synthase [Sinomonas cyclohexanicum]|uniref:Naringenin-chalcone synthase n=1 Tax=Sinomonas cyclohexanicum TaxID=322009 RepID=A0ABN6FLZ9_SINCY|nr:type III polyketide synthase [Corynebacterium cyclohexanicum]BCT77834.1 naringenin-chalcone synthase [Corynebacterium cyclohexanicum]
MAVLVRSLETSVPTTVLKQPEARDVFAAQEGLTRLGQRLVKTCFDAAAIDTRYSAVAEFSWDRPDHSPDFFDSSTGTLLTPSTKTRNDLFAREGTPLFTQTARRALEGADGIAAEDVTHVVTVSCTGFFNPGPDYRIVRELGLNPSVQRFHLGFMGCYAAFPALRMAKAFCDADPNAVVLVAIVELCSLHVRSSNDPDTILGASLFADGAAAAIVTARDLPVTRPSLSLDAFETTLTPVGEETMAWNVGDHGFEMVLGTYVPHIIDDHITGALEPLLARDAALAGRPHADIEHWAIHPGGRSIVDKVAARLALTDAQAAPAYDTLREFGNMSSATVMFVLERILGLPVAEAHDGAGPGAERICAMAFGPGLTVETALMTRVLP